MSTDERRSTSAKKRNVAPSDEDVKKATQSQDRAKQALKKRKKNTFWDQYSYHIIIGGFGLIVIVTLLSTMFGKTKKLHLTPVIENDEIEAHNANQFGYKLGPNSFYQDWTLADAKKIFNNAFSYKQSLSRCNALDENTILESHYDFREAHPKCSSPVVDQKNCSSSYAVASASALSDRFCQQTGQNVRLSAQHFLSCQEGDDDKACSGGAIATFLDYAKRKGVVDESCVPYQGENVPCDPNSEQCQKYHVLDYCVSSGVEGIKRDIFKNGPVIGFIPIFRDFLVYKSGIYRVQEGTSRFQGGHAVKVVGWGQTEQGDGYWIVENSWGEDWGVKGHAHVAIGQEELLLDQYAFSPNPKVDKTEEETETPKEKEEVVNA